MAQLAFGRGCAAAEPANKRGCERMALPGTQPGQQKEESRVGLGCVRNANTGGDGRGLDWEENR